MIMLILKSLTTSGVHEKIKKGCPVLSKIIDSHNSVSLFLINLL